jgi:hypothetical protein
MFHKQYFSSSSFLPTLKVSFFATNVFLWVVSVTLMIVYAMESTSIPPPLPPLQPPSAPPNGTFVGVFAAPPPSSGEGNIFYELTIFAVIIFDLFLALGYTVYGIRAMLRKTHNAVVEGADAASLYCELFKTTLTNSIFALCFLCRVVLFSLRPIAGILVSDTLFRFLGYYLPELVPAILQLLLLVSASRKLRQNRAFIDQLYDEEEDQLQHQHQQNQKDAVVNETTPILARN